VDIPKLGISADVGGSDGVGGVLDGPPTACEPIVPSTPRVAMSLPSLGAAADRSKSSVRSTTVSRKYKSRLWGPAPLRATGQSGC
jgi:hypothetical protein